jgi:AraC-like DNA-binding protein
MPSSAIHTFTDPDEYTAAFRGSQAQLTVHARGQFSAQLTWLRLHSLQIQRFSENLPRVLRVAHTHRRATISFISGSRQIWGGTELEPGHLTLHNLDQDHFHQSFGLAASGFMSLPVEDLMSVGATMAGRDLTPPPNALTFRPSPQALASLRQLHGAAGALAHKAPEIIVNPQVARGLEQALIGAVAGCLADHPQDKRSLAQRRHEVVMRRFWQVVEESAGQPLYIPEICSAIQVSERTLLACCHEHLGMAPKRYLLLRRMALARRSLREQAAGTTSVTDIAMRYGFWDLGRFAVEYKALFGESPSFTLRGPGAAARPFRSGISLSATRAGH